MKRKIWENRSVIAEGMIILIVFILLYFAVSQSSAQYVIIAGFFITGVFFTYMSVKHKVQLRGVIRRVTNEIAKLPDDLSEKSYDYIQDETRVFYEELAHVKKLLDQKGRMRQELLDIANTVAVNMDFSQLLHDLLPKLNEATRSTCSAFYTINYSTNKLEIKHSIGFSKNIYSEFDLTLGEGMIGQAATNNEVTVFRDIPEDTVYLVRSFLGKIKPRCVIVVPVTSQEKINGVLVCASVYNYTHEDRDMIELIRHYLGVGVNNGINYDKNKRLNNELIFQNKLIQDQHLDTKKRLDEKTQMLNHIVDNIEEGCLYALDTRGLILLWNKGAERIHGIPASGAMGRNIDRVYEENNWPPVNKAIQQAVINGFYTECFWRESGGSDRQHYEMKITCLYNELRESIGVLTSIRAV